MFRKLLLVCIYFISSLSVFAYENWVNTYNTTPPIVFLDTNSIKRFNSGAVYNVRYINKNNNEVLAQVYTDLKGNASVWAVYDYDETKEYDTFKIPNNLKMKAITSESSIYESTIYVRDAVLKGKIKFCAPNKCFNDNSSDVNINYSNSSNSTSNSNYTYNSTSNSTYNISDKSSTLIIGARDTPEVITYMREIENKIKDNWNPPIVDKPSCFELGFSIAKDGQLLPYKDIRIVTGVEELDRAALNAIELSAPFKPLPYGIKTQYLNVLIWFDYDNTSKPSFRMMIVD